MIVLKLAFAAIAFIVPFIATVGGYDSDRDKALYYKRHHEPKTGDVWASTALGYGFTVFGLPVVLWLEHFISLELVPFIAWVVFVTALLYIVWRIAHPWLQEQNTPNVDSRGYPLTDERTKNQQLADK